MKELCLVFLINGDKIILAPKKRVTGKREFLIGKLNGYGGTLEKGECPEDALEREGIEEGRKDKEKSKFKVRKEDLQKAAELYFFFAGVKRFKCYTFLTERWEGQPEESDEMGKPEEFPRSNLPFDRMMPGDIKFLPIILSGETIEGEVFFDETGEKLIDFKYKEVKF